MGGYVMGQFEKPAEPAQFTPAEVGYLNPVICSANNGTNCNDNDVEQIMPASVIGSGIWELGEVNNESRRGWSGQ
jgi:hypothetical protein